MVAVSRYRDCVARRLELNQAVLKEGFKGLSVVNLCVEGVREQQFELWQIRAKIEGFDTRRFDYLLRLSKIGGFNSIVHLF